ncbi:MAG: MMPL family transporter [Myxococcales bacterium]|nr:MMPL family transporter [Myxococcales bacterium]
MTRLGRGAWIVIALLAMEAVYVTSRLELVTGLAHLLPDARDQELAWVSARLVDSPLTRTMVLSVSAPELPAAIAGMREFAAAVAPHPEVASLRVGPEEGFPEAVHALYFPRRSYFLSNQPEAELPLRFSDEGLDRAAARLRGELASPRADLVKSLAAEDPVLAFLDLARGFERSAQRNLQVVDGHFAATGEGEPAAIAFLETEHSAFDASAQGPFQVFLEERFAAVQATDSRLRLERSAVHRFALESERRARADMGWISAISVLGIVLLFVFVVRSVRLLVVSMLPLLGGMLTASAVGLLVFGELHVMTLAFGGTLIGVCLDYPIHLVSHFVLGRSAGRDGAVRGAVRIGALTTAAGFGGLALADVPGVREIGVFAASGVLGALLTTLYLMPDLLPSASPPPPLPARIAAGLGGILEAMRRRPGVLVAILALTGVVTVAGLSRLVIEDDVYALGFQPEAVWLEEDTRVRERVSRVDAGHFVVALGENEETALRRNDEVFARLEEARERGAIAGFRSLHPFLFSAELQRRNQAALEAVPGLTTRMHAALEAQGFRAEAFAPMGRAPAFAPLRFADLVGSPLAPLVAPYRLEVKDQVAFLSFLRGVDPAGGLEERFADLSGVRFVDQRLLLERAYRATRARATELAGLGLLAVFALLGVYYRSLRGGIVALLPALLAAGASLAILALLEIPLNLMHLLALLLVLSIGVDYAVFLLASPRDAGARAASAFSLVVACASTLLAFGLLSLSSFPALRPLGVTTGLGVLLSLLLAPMVVLLSESGRSR